MKKTIVFALGLTLSAFNFSTYAQELQTVFKNPTSSGGYGAITNKFTYINGEYANLVGLYGGWYVNHRFLLGLSGSALTNNLRVPVEHRADPSLDLSYQYVQFGLLTEYVFMSNKTFHFVFTLETSAGLTFQYQRYNWEYDYYAYPVKDENWFFVAEPGIQLELNLLKWMRFSPGVSYRSTFGSDSKGLPDNALSDISYNVTLKFGKF